MGESAFSSLCPDRTHEAPLPAFFTRLLDRESNIDSAKLAWYEENLDREVLDYWAVDAPGRVRRAWDTGEALRERVTVREFLSRTGVFRLFADRARLGIEAVQAAVVNPWGFVGFQFGEPLLMDLGYYEPETVTTKANPAGLPVYYAGPVAPETWRHGRTSFVPPGENRVATDVNTWRGTFTGKDGVRSLADLRTLGAQVTILRSSLRHSLAVLGELAGPLAGDPWDGSWPGPAPAALLAACHLCGPYGVAAHLASGSAPSDEAGTPITAYLTEFADVELTREDVYGGSAAWRGTEARTR
ncbi:hypothetical protein ILP97_23640 [Amycolatopsis sp. H6(2020)]|nr:hypothetical protein [Amycolatopsis sp. H6(2020)]